MSYQVCFVSRIMVCESEHLLNAVGVTRWQNVFLTENSCLSPCGNLFVAGQLIHIYMLSVFALRNNLFKGIIWPVYRTEYANNRLRLNIIWFSLGDLLFVSCTVASNLLLSKGLDKQGKSIYWKEMNVVSFFDIQPLCRCSIISLDR